MRFMMIVYPGPKAEAGGMPDEKVIAAMMKYNEELAKAGALLALDGLQPTARGARVRFTKEKPIVTDGPFAETREQLAGYYLVDAKDLDAALAIAARIPGAKTGSIEVRPIMVYN